MMTYEKEELLSLKYKTLNLTTKSDRLRKNNPDFTRLLFNGSAVMAHFKNEYINLLNLPENENVLVYGTLNLILQSGIQDPKIISQILCLMMCSHEKEISYETFLKEIDFKNEFICFLDETLKSKKTGKKYSFLSLFLSLLFIPKDLSLVSRLDSKDYIYTEIIEIIIACVDKIPYISANDTYDKTINLNDDKPMVYKNLITEGVKSFIFLTSSQAFSQTNFELNIRKIISGFYPSNGIFFDFTAPTVFNSLTASFMDNFWGAIPYSRKIEIMKVN